MIPFVDLRAQYEAIKPEIDAAIASVIADCSFVQGKYCEEFEKNFADACGSAYTLGCSNGTTALELALRAYGVSEGDEVIVPSHTFIATAEVISLLGAVPVFAEISEDTFTIDPSDIEHRITDKTKAIIPVHLYGQSADMDPIYEIAKTHNLVVIEDSAQAHLTEYKGKVLPVGELGTFSFYPGKNLGAYGDAGGVVTSSKELYAHMSAMLNHGRGPGEKYKHSSIGTNYRMDGLQGAVLNVKLQHLPEWTERRREVAKMYMEELKDVDVTLPIEADYGKHVWHLFVIRVKNRDEVMAYLQENGVSCGVHYPIPLHLQPAYKSLGYSEGDFPITEQATKDILSLPICGSISDESVEKVISTLKEALSNS